MTGSQLFWMAVQALTIGGLTYAYWIDHPKGPPIGALFVFIVVVGFMTAVIVNWKDAIIRRWRGIPAPPKASAGEPLYQLAPSKKMTAWRILSLLAHIAAIAAVAAWLEYIAPGEPKYTISVPIAFVFVLVCASLLHRIKEYAAGKKLAGTHVESDGRSIEILPPKRTR